jgi:hypothetical protein
MQHATKPRGGVGCSPARIYNVLVTLHFAEMKGKQLKKESTKLSLGAETSRSAGGTPQWSP